MRSSRIGARSVLAPLAVLLTIEGVRAAPEPVPEEALELEPLAESLGNELAPDGFGGDLRAWAAYAAIEGGRFVRARELAEQIVRDDPASISGHVLLGMVLHRGEGSLARAHYHLSRSRELFESRFGRRSDPDQSPWFWHWIALYQLASLAGEMERHSDELAYLSELEELYGFARPAQRGWPLMRLHRLVEGRAAARAGLARGDRQGALTSYTALCAIEAEAGDREASYRACLKAVELGSGEDAYALYLSNGAEAALAMLRMPEAERLLLTATEHFTRPTLANPWMDLVHLYLSQGRAAEALGAMREMFSWRLRQPPTVDVQTWGETELASALFLIAAGRPREAARVTGRAVERPDRAGLNSADFRQKRSAAALLDRVAHRAASEVEREAASWLPWRGALLARARAIAHRLHAWLSGRRAAALFADDRVLQYRMRPYMGGVVKIPTWIELELVGTLGPGPVEAALRRARARETLPGTGGYFGALEAEVAAVRGDWDGAAALAARVLEALPPSEALLRARVAAIGALAAAARGRPEREVELWELALQLEPGVVRRVGAALPSVFESGDHPVARAASRHLRSSPRLREAREGFRVRVEANESAGSACLLSPRGTVFGCVRAEPRAEDDGEDLARRLAAGFHRRVFAPRVDLTQADLRSLDGSTLAGGGRSAERLRVIVDGLLD